MRISGLRVANPDRPRMRFIRLNEISLWGVALLRGLPHKRHALAVRGPHRIRIGIHTGRKKSHALPGCVVNPDERMIAALGYEQQILRHGRPSERYVLSTRNNLLRLILP